MGSDIELSWHLEQEASRMLLIAPEQPLLRRRLSQPRPMSPPGALIAVNFSLVFVVAAVETVRERWKMPWVTIGLQVIASWIAAIAALITVLSIR